MHRAVTTLSIVLAGSSLAPTTSSCQSRPDLYRCEGCEAIYEHSFEGLTWSIVIPPGDEPGERMVLTGHVYQTDSETPAPDVIIYAHHTNTGGVYPTRGDEEGWGRRHGYLRGWVKTNAEGAYRFETIRPGSYPGRPDPAHVHLTVKEPGRQEYWIDEVVFTDDPRLTAAYRDRVDGRGGSGIVTPVRDSSGVWIARRDIVLER